MVFSVQERKMSYHEGTYRVQQRNKVNTVVFGIQFAKRLTQERGNDPTLYLFSAEFLQKKVKKQSLPLSHLNRFRTNHSYA